MDYNAQNNAVLNEVLERYFFKGFRTESDRLIHLVSANMDGFKRFLGWYQASGFNTTIKIPYSLDMLDMIYQSGCSVKHIIVETDLALMDDAYQMAMVADYASKMSIQFDVRLDESIVVDAVYYDGIFKFLNTYDCTYTIMVTPVNAASIAYRYLWYTTYAKPRFVIDKSAEWNEESLQGMVHLLEAMVRVEYNADNNFITKHIVGNSDELFALSMRLPDDGLEFQSELIIDLDTLSIVPCPGVDSFWVLGQITDTGIEARNLELFLTLYSARSNNLPRCEQCSIKHLCNKGSIAEQIKQKREPFTPMDDICNMQLTRVRTLINAFDKLDILSGALTQMDPLKRKVIKSLKAGVLQ